MRPKSISSNIMSNIAELQNNNEYLNHFISLLYKDNELDINTKVEVDRWKGHWNDSTENTSSSCSGLHFGHYKAMNGAHDMAYCKVICNFSY